MLVVPLIIAIVHGFTNMLSKYYSMWKCYMPELVFLFQLTMFSDLLTRH